MSNARQFRPALALYMQTKTFEEYAQKRANETGQPYAVFECILKPDLKYSALNCGFNRIAYASIGARVLQTFKPLKK